MDAHYFIALPIADEQLIQFATTLQLEQYYKTVYEPGEYHLTLRFLGALTETELADWRTRLLDIVETMQGLTLHLDHLERFGLAERPRVFAVGPSLNNQLLQLAQKIDPTPHQPFLPHVTLAKKWRQEVTLLPPEGIPASYVDVNEIILYKICPTSRPRYQVDTRFQFGKK
ncbi:2'-5' RNA ligase [Exiguobacterium sp. KRL4]|uniref:RNA 2',3'-cyclic phosphodiesterase n=1 Tax=Exiguobacterium sp. KRL4 TaxID=1914536 RepID=UPI0008F8C1F4|nr:RNA 2',3'-cyclic phosphodiesterase [Exiguobacterium sp. KRL4]OIN67087.1 2'-5' RNA ligase [Exiguobacterium sp. KRL4]